MDTALLKQYAQLNKKIERLEEEKGLLRNSILAELNLNKIEKAETNYGIFTIGHRRSYTYTEVVKKLEEKLKITKVKEEQSGLAKEKVTDYLVYTK